MSNDLRRALVALLCVATLVFAASLFPSAGFGSQPRTGLGGGDGGGSDLRRTAEPVGTVDESTPGEATGTTATTPTATATRTATETSTETATETETTEEAAGGDGPPIGPDLVSALAGLLLLCVAVLALLVAGSGREYEAGGVTIRIPDVRGGLRSIPRLTMGFLIGVGATMPRLLDDAGTLLGAFGRGLEATATGMGRALVGSARVISRGLGDAAFELPRAVGGTLFSLPNALSGIGSGLGRRSAGSGNAGRGTGGGTDAPAEPVDTGPPSVREAWEEMVASVPTRNRRARTPGEYARRAIDAGFPPEAVRRLTAAFNEVRYGDLPPSEERTEAARAALADVARHLKGDEP